MMSMSHACVRKTVQTNWLIFYVEGKLDITLINLVCIIYIIYNIHIFITLFPQGKIPSIISSLIVPVGKKRDSYKDKKVNRLTDRLSDR